MDRALRLTSGVFLLLVLLIGILPSNVNWFWKFFLLFMSLNQIQSAFTNWCPVMVLYRKLGIKECE
ncbi:YgaP family membrane protein [Thermocrinis sp.]|uniref:YgaP family membrane protein n=1 Tax=Thermocrinis sp. TaxID=2024383 RepID=UPI003C0512C3